MERMSVHRPTRSQGGVCLAPCAGPAQAAPRGGARPEMRDCRTNRTRPGLSLRNEPNRPRRARRSSCQRGAAKRTQSPGTARLRNEPNFRGCASAERTHRLARGRCETNPIGHGEPAARPASVVLRNEPNRPGRQDCETNPIRAKPLPCRGLQPRQPSLGPGRSSAVVSASNYGLYRIISSCVRLRAAGEHAQVLGLLEARSAARIGTAAWAATSQPRATRPGCDGRRLWDDGREARPRDAAAGPDEGLTRAKPAPERRAKR